MAVSKSSKPRRTSKRTTAGTITGWRAWAQLFAALLFLAILGGSALWWFHQQGYLLYFGDAQAHLNIARRIVDSRTPGFVQLGTVWLPVPHLAMLPFVSNDAWWRSGLAGGIPASCAFVIAGAFLFAAARRALGSGAAGFAVAAVFALNPNLLYLQSTAMTEPFFFAGLAGLLYFVVLFSQTGSLWAAVGAALLSNVASMTRYEGWFLIPFAGLAIFLSGQSGRIRAAAVFAVLASLGPLWWLGYNWYNYGDPLEFYRGPYSAKAIYQRALDQGMARYPGDHEWDKAWLYFREAAKLCAGSALVWLGLAGLIPALWKRAFIPLLLLSLGPFFYVWSMHSSGTPIFVPHLWPNSYYNTRYGLAALPLLAFAAGAIVAVVPNRFRSLAVPAVIAIAITPWLAHPDPENWICWKESEVNSNTRRAWTREAADYLKAHYRQHSGVFTSFGDMTGIFGQAGIPLRETLHEGNGPAWLAAATLPELFLFEEWVVAMAGDKVSTAMLRAGRFGSRYVRVKTIRSKDGPEIEIYRRDRNNEDEDPLYKSSRGEE